MEHKPLKGITVLDLTRLLPGPMCTLHLADMGADVIKIEDIGMGDYARSIPPIQNNNSIFFNAVNRNKRSVAIDITTADGKAVFFKLLEKADVVVESFRPGVVQKLGIDYETVKQIKPNIVYCAITGYGQTGPYSKLAGHDINYCSYSGVLDRNENAPFIPNFQIADIVGGALNAAVGILAALVQQKVSGVGQYIDISMMDGLLAHHTTALAQLNSEQKGLLVGTLPCYAIYQTADNKYMALGALEFKFWERFCKAVEREDLIPLYMTSEDQAKQTMDEVATIFKSNTREYWTQKLVPTDCCASPVLSLNETLSNEQVVARKMVQFFENETEGKMQQFALPIKFSGFEFNIQRPAPLQGQHTEMELSKIGYSSTQIQELRNNKIIL